MQKFICHLKPRNSNQVIFSLFHRNYIHEFRRIECMLTLATLKLVCVFGPCILIINELLPFKEKLVPACVQVSPISFALCGKRMFA